jgi:hypothetical protein
MPPRIKTILFLIILALEIGFILWTRFSYSHKFLDTLR